MRIYSHDLESGMLSIAFIVLVYETSESGKSSCPQIIQINADKSLGCTISPIHPLGVIRKTNSTMKICGNLRNLRIQSPFLG